jgi:hypothetical protein
MYLESFPSKVLTFSTLGNFLINSIFAIWNIIYYSFLIWFAEKPIENEPSLCKSCLFIFLCFFLVLNY